MNRALIGVGISASFELDATSTQHRNFNLNPHLDLLLFDSISPRSLLRMAIHAPHQYLAMVTAFHCHLRSFASPHNSLRASNLKSSRQAPFGSGIYKAHELALRCLVNCTCCWTIQHGNCNGFGHWGHGFLCLSREPLPGRHTCGPHISLIAACG